ncbi:hypothetical protein quinque_010326 [Culex quinquefasciatus]
MLSLLRTSSNLKSVGYQLRHVTMDSSLSQLKHLFAGAVDAVKPGAMFERYFRDESVLRQLQNADKNYHLVGFGKAVLGMAVQMERILGDRLTSGCISIPVGTLERFRGEQDFQLSRANRDILLVSGGEPTVIVKGTGLGGRNQELALRFSVQCFQQELLKGVLLLSAGTDGIDGPTDAAGAIGGAEVVERFQTLDCEQPVEKFISNNDSYSFYKEVDKGRFHVVTGHTGTNVMDIQMLLIPKIIL